MFRSLQPQHRPHIEAMLRETGMFDDREVEVCLEIADEVLEDPEKGEYIFECALDEKEKPVGFVVYGEASLADRVWEIYWIAVDPRKHRQGSGRNILDHAEGNMRAAGARMCVVETSGRPQYEGTGKFYLRCGYREAARISDFYREGDDLVIYRKDFGVR